MMPAFRKYTVLDTFQRRKFILLLCRLLQLIREEAETLKLSSVQKEPMPKQLHWACLDEEGIGIEFVELLAINGGFTQSAMLREVTFEII